MVATWGFLATSGFLVASLTVMMLLLGFAGLYAPDYDRVYG